MPNVNRNIGGPGRGRTDIALSGGVRIRWVYLFSYRSMYILVGVDGFEPTHPKERIYSPLRALQLGRTPIRKTHLTSIQSRAFCYASGKCVYLTTKIPAK